MLEKHIYTIRCMANNRMYVGMTRDFEKRKIMHIRDLRAGRHASRLLQMDYEKYGLQAFKFKRLHAGVYRLSEAKAIARIMRVTEIYNKVIPHKIIHENGF